MPSPLNEQQLDELRRLLLGVDKRCDRLEAAILQLAAILNREQPPQPPTLPPVH